MKIDRIVRPPTSVIILNDHGWSNGGQAEVAIHSAVQLKQRGFDVCFIAGVGPIDQRLLDVGVECHAIGDHDILSDPDRVRAAVRGIWNPEAARRLARSIADRDTASTVIHVHGWSKALSPSIGPVVTGAQAAHVYTLHEYFLGCPNGGFYDYRAQRICRHRALGASCLTTRCDVRSDHHKIWRVARQAVLWTKGRMPSGLRELIYLMPEQRSILKPYVSSDARWHHLPNAAGVRPSRRIAAEKNEFFLFIGRLSAEKGAEVAAAAARQAGVPIAFCGDGERRDAVRKANPEAELLGWLDAHEVKEWMQRARCLVFPSLWYECYPLVVAEALRAGIPILVADTCLAASLVPHDVAGRHVPPADVRAWSEAMTCLKSDELARSYSKGAFAAGAGLLDEDQHITRLISIYSAALARKQLDPVAREELLQ